MLALFLLQTTDMFDRHILEFSVVFCVVITL